MSEDRFKQARRSLLDRQNQRQEGFDDDFEDEATSMVDLGSVRSGGHGAPVQPQAPAYQRDDATELVSVNARTMAPSKPSVSIPAPAAAPAPSAGHGARGPVVIGEAAGEGATAFIDISALAAGPSGSPEPKPSEGNTQFIDINQLQAGAGVHAQGSVETDPVLRQSYAFGPESIQQGEFTLIFANDYSGRPVVLKRIWEGDVNTMPMELRQRVAMLDQIKHPRLIGLTGMFASPSGAWVEVPRPGGYRLTDVLGGRGPQPPEQVTRWAQQIAEVLSFVHQFQFVYANLTTDAVWVQDDGNVLIEPFDILTFENRGNLGVFGPPELNFPPHQRQVYPATDVYSLAVLTVAMLTGLPVNLGAIAQLPKPFSEICLKGIQQNPAERVPTPAEFGQALGGGGKTKGAKAGGAKQLDMKIVIGGVVAVGVLTIAVLAMMQGGGGGGQQVVDEPIEVAQASSTNGAAALAPLPEGLTVEGDPRVEVVAGIQTSPVVASTEAADPEAADKLRQEARAALTGVDRLNDEGKRAKYQESLSKMVAAVRLSSLTDEDRAFLSSLSAEKLVQQMREQKLKEVQEALQKGNLGSTKLGYTGLEALDPSAKHTAFFNRNKTVKIRPLTRAGQEPEGGQE
jgi:serine/threonine protein kinase